MPPPRLKRSNTAGAVPASLSDAEIAINQADGKIFYHTAAGGVGEISGAGGGSAYTLPTASSSQLGGIRVGDGLQISSGVLSVNVGSGLSISGGAVTASGTSDSRWDLFLPPAPTSMSATAGNAQATVSWTAPTVLSQTPITDYKIQVSSNSGSTWSLFTDSVSTATSATVTGLTNGTAYVFRVAAVTGIGQGAWSSASSAVTPRAFSPSAVILTSGTSYTVPAGAYNCKAWVVGAGGSVGAGVGNAGAVCYKTWSVTPGDSIVYSLGANSTYFSRSNTTVTYNSTTISAQSGSGSDWNATQAATWSGGDGGVDGGLHGYPSGSGGSGGAVGGNSGPATCGRYTATDVSGLFAAVVLAGGSVTETCGATAAFGSGGTVNAALNAGIGGGGAYYYQGQESTAGGSSAIVLYFY
jgi:hypothetical protein